MSVIKLGKKTIKSDGELVYFIAEIGQNHQGDINIAKQMISAAKRAGCDCVKFQKSSLSAKFTNAALSRRYDGVNSWGNTYGEHKTYLEFDLEQYKDLQNYCTKVEIDFTASAMDEISLEQLDALNVPFIKIGSGDTNNFPLLIRASKLQCPLVISTGMQTMATIEKIVEIMEQENKTNYALLHCVSAYPTAYSDCSLQLITIFKKKFPNIVIGYSGHEIGINISKAAVLLGARIVERHFTLDKTLKGSDHKCSLETPEFLQMVADVKLLQCDNLLKITHGTDEILNILVNTKDLQMALKDVQSKVILACEMDCKSKLGKSLVAARALKCGQCLQKEDICIKVSEPNGLSAEHYFTVLGTLLQKDVVADEPITKEHVNVSSK